TRARRASANRRRRGSLRDRLPKGGELRAALARGLRAALPSLLALGGMAAVAGGAALATRWLTGSPRFALAEVEVRGASPAPREEIVEALAPAMGENVFRVSLEAIERRLRREPWIADVSVRRSLPDGLIIEVEE